MNNDLDSHFPSKITSFVRFLEGSSDSLSGIPLKSHRNQRVTVGLLIRCEQFLLIGRR